MCASALHDSAAVYKTLREQLPATTQFVGQPSVGGVVVDGQWLTNQGYFLAVMGIADPDGAYVTFAAEYEVRESRESEKTALAPRSMRAPTP